jgi:coproporphyrinogen III oxidase-like Fe-S oxidoreductase
MTTLAAGIVDAMRPERPHFAALPPLALYVHVPWCLKKCPYCDFNSHEARGTIPEERYVDALVADLEFALPAIWGRKVASVFIGGGTPSLFTASAIDRLWRGSGRACHCCRMSRSRSKPIPAPSSVRSSPVFSAPA